MFEELGITEVIDKATQQDPAMRIVTAGHAVKAMVLNGLGLPQPEPTNGTGSTKQWRPCTPAMAAGLTDHVWTLREVLLYRVPPWPRPQAL
jgi:hypothetical protein